MRDRWTRATASRLSGAMILVIALVLSASWATKAAALSNGRVYELVTPPDTGAVTPAAKAIGIPDGESCFETNLATADGERVMFTSEIGSLEGLASNGLLNLYETRRTPGGWITASNSATGHQSTEPAGGLCSSPDHEYSTFTTGPFDRGTLAIEGAAVSYFRTPGGSYVIAGIGSIGTDLEANIKLISAGAAHVVFTSRKRLEPAAPAALGTASSFNGAGEFPVNAVYDRTSLGLKVMSLLPSGAAPNSNSETTFYRGVSPDGSSVVFEVVKSDGTATLYERRKEGPTVEIVSSPVSGEYRYGGISGDGRRVVYVKPGSGADQNPVRGSIYLFDAVTGASTPVTIGSEAALVNFSDDGSHVYFTSEEALPGSGENPLGASAQASSPNLYVWDEDSADTQFIATVSPEDVDENVSVHENLTEWLQTVAAPQQNPLVGRMRSTSRTTPDGTTFVFQAHGSATDYDSGGHREIYLYNGLADELICVSCPKDGDPATYDAYLQRPSINSTSALNALARLANVSDDGRIVFFMTGEALVPSDVNEIYDVYEWNAGQVSLISSGESAQPSVLYGMSADGRDVFFLTIDRLVPQDISSVASIYDARIGGGVPPPTPAPSCEGDSCQGTPLSSPGRVGVGSEVQNAFGQAIPRRPKRCGKHKPRRKHCKHKPRRSSRQLPRQAGVRG